MYKDDSITDNELMWHLTDLVGSPTRLVTYKRRAYNSQTVTIDLVKESTIVLYDDLR